MSHFQIKTLTLPHEGIIPGAPGHKKIVVPSGTTIYCIKYRTKFYWCGYLDEQQAAKCLRGLESNDIPLDVLVAWNFKAAIPKRIARVAK
jgi:hypothetical protein